MSISTEILKFATDRQQFSRQELFKSFANLSERTLSQTLYRLLKNKRLERIEQDVYYLPVCVFAVSDEVKQIYLLLKEKFPFADLCIWSSDVLIPFMHHVPNLNYIYVDVENEVAESAFNFLKGTQSKAVFFRPSSEEYYRYIDGKHAIIVRNLITESPLQTIGNVQVPTFEKILVDIAGDVEFDFMQGAEITYFYKNAMERNEINKRKLLRYASRRGRRTEVEQLYINAL